MEHFVVNYSIQMMPTVYKPAIWKLNSQLLLQGLQWPFASASLTFSSTEQEGKHGWTMIWNRNSFFTLWFGTSVHWKAVQIMFTWNENRSWKCLVYKPSEYWPCFYWPLLQELHCLGDGTLCSFSQTRDWGPSSACAVSFSLLLAGEVWHSVWIWQNSHTKTEQLSWRLSASSSSDKKKQMSV